MFYTQTVLNAPYRRRVLYAIQRVMRWYYVVYLKILHVYLTVPLNQIDGALVYLMALCINRRSSPLFDGTFWFARIGWVCEMSVTSYGVRGVAHMPPPTHAECVITATR